MYVFYLQIEGGILDTFEKCWIFWAGRTIIFCTLCRQYCVGVLINRTNRIIIWSLKNEYRRAKTKTNLCTVQCPPVQHNKEGGWNKRSLLGSAELNTNSTFRSPSQRIQIVSPLPTAKGEFPRFSRIHLTYFPAGHYHLASEVLVSTEGRICDWSTLWSMGSESV